MTDHVGTGARDGLGADFGLGAFEQSPEFEGGVEPPGGCGHGNGHFAVIYETLEERFAATVPFVRQGLEQGECCLYVIEEAARRERILDALRDGGVDVERALDADQLAFYTPEETYLRQRPFDPDEMIDFYRDLLDDVLAEFDGLRISAGTNWIEQVPRDAFLEYEGRVNELFDDHDAMALCHYDRTELPSEMIHEVVQTHPHLIYDEQVCHNFYYVPSDEYIHDQGADGTDQMLRTLRDRSKARTELTKHNRFLQRLNEITADPDRSFEAKLQALFDLGCEQFDLELGGLNRVDAEADRFEVEFLSGDHEFFEEGLEVPLSETYCRAPTEVMETISVSDPVAEGFDDIAIYAEYGAEAYLGTHIVIEGDDDRTFAFISSEPRTEPFTEADRTLIELMARWVKYELERKRREEKLRRSNDRLAAVNNVYAAVHEINQGLAKQSTRAEIEQVVCERLAASDSYAFAWIGTVEGDEVRPSASANTRGYLDDITVTVDDSPTGRGPTGRAVRTGETQVVRRVADDDTYEPWREHATKRDIAATAAVPITYENERYGLLNVYTTRNGAFDDEERDVIDQLGNIIGLAIAATEHERELEHERERLEFFNRLIRHNLLNSLNVVRARAGVLDPHVDASARQHLDVIEARTNEMIDLIEALRSLMQAIIEGSEHELESVDVGTTLRDEFRKAAQTYEHAEFRIDGELDAGAVVADDLLGEVFENVLINAVQHNDTAVPTVTVSVDGGAEMTTVSIADNGPGIPDERKEAIFRKGEKSFDSPGTGFGLHLVREIVDAYDGEIRVADNEPTGTVFRISLPRASDQ